MSGTHRVIIGGVFSIKNDNFRHDEAAGNLHHASMSSDFHAHIIGDEHLFAVAGNEIGCRSAATAPVVELVDCCCCPVVAIGLQCFGQLMKMGRCHWKTTVEWCRNLVCFLLKIYRRRYHCLRIESSESSYFPLTTIVSTWKEREITMNWTCGVRVVFNIKKL